MRRTVLFALCTALSLAHLWGCGNDESASPWVTVTVLAEPKVKAELEHVQVLRDNTSVSFWLQNPPDGRPASGFPLSFDLRGEGAGQIDIVGYAQGKERIRRTLALPRLPKGRSFLTIMLRDGCLDAQLMCAEGSSCGGCEPEARCVPVDVSEQLGRRPTAAEMCVGAEGDGGAGLDGDDAGGSGGELDGALGGGDAAVGPDGAVGGDKDDSGSPGGSAPSTGALRPLAAGRCAGIEVPRPEGDSASAPWSVRVEGRPGTLASDPECKSALSEVAFDAGSASRSLYFRPDPLPAGEYLGESKLVFTRGGARAELALEVRRAALALEAGLWWACALLDDATLQCWGDGVGGLLLREDPFSPVPVRAQVPPAGLSSDTRLAATEFTGYALTAGKLSAWGENGGGQLGIGSVFFGSHMPYGPVGMQSGVTQVAGGGDHVCAVKDGAAYCWGSNASGSVGGDAFPTTTPRKVAELDPGVVEEVAVGWDFSCARLSDGAVKCWGAGGAGQLGNGGIDNAAQPTDVILPGPASRIWAGAKRGCARVGEDLYCWGDAILQPVPVDAPKPVDDMMLLEYAFCVQSAGDLYCRGNNTLGLLGTGATSQQLASFERVLLPTKVEQLAQHAALALCDGVVYGWGFDEGPTLGLSPLAGAVLRPTPTHLFDGLDVDSVSFGWSFGCARKRADGQVVCWGWDRFGALGQGDTQYHNTILGKPKPVVALPTGVDALAVYGNHVFALRDGQIYGWGKNLYGQLGRGVIEHGAAATPAPVSILPAGAKVARVVAWSERGCALVQDSGALDGVYCWGGVESEDGDPSEVTRFYAADAGVTDLAGAGDFACAVVKGGVECWGGEANSMTPVAVTGLAPDSGKGVVDVEVGDGYACARSSQNAVWCWTDALAASPISIQARVLAVGSYSACAIDLADELWCWNGPAWDGGNARGQLGQGDKVVRYVPTKVPLKAPVTQVSIMQDTVLARDAEGYKCWGDQQRRRCGLRPWIVSTPTPIAGWDVNGN